MLEKKILPVSIVITLWNEEASIREVLDSLLNQSCQPEEIVIADGGSTDATCHIIREEYQPRFPGLLLIEVPGNIAKGRNQAILKAHQEIIAVTDAGCRAARVRCRNRWLTAAGYRNRALPRWIGANRRRPKTCWPKP